MRDKESACKRSVGGGLRKHNNSTKLIVKVYKGVGSLNSNFARVIASLRHLEPWALSLANLSTVTWH